MTVRPRSLSLVGTLPLSLVCTLPLLGGLLLGGCGGKNGEGGDGDDGGGDGGGGGETFTFATYNVGLAAGFVPYTPERAPEVASALSSFEADAICLQEVWTQADIDAIKAATATSFPYAVNEFTTEDGATGDPACTEEEVAPLEACALEFCAETDDLTGCVLSYCSAEFDALSDVCTECAAANIGLDDVEAIIEVCLTGSGTFTWGGQNGLLLLLKDEPTTTEYLSMPSWLVQRGVLYAEVNGVHVGCTHLAAVLGAPAYTGEDYASYEAENLAQAQAALAFLDDRAAGGPRALLGDLNTSPALAGGLTAEVPETWGAIAAAGWFDANVAASAPFCTWCAENSLTKSPDSRAIDHILVQGMTSDAPARIFDGEVTITGLEGDVSVPLSDHFGFQAAVTLP
jgi:endonuclease/exonuclease/phosphatase family metal-dependent hydrolase